TEHGLFRWSGERLIAVDAASLGGVRVLALGTDAHGRLLVGTDGGAFRQRDSSFERLPVAGPVAALAVAPDGALWFGTPRGVGVLGPKGVSWLRRIDGLAGDDVRALLRDRFGAIWVGTRAGLAVFHDGQTTTFTAERGLVDEHVNALAQA